MSGASPPPRFDALPIEAAARDYAEALADSVPVVVVAPTGSGKSTRLPVWTAEHLDAPVLVVEPRRVACRALADYVARSAFGEGVGAQVGFRVRFETRGDPRTRLWFVTPGVALNLLARRPFEYAAVIVDEFHERSWQIDLVVALVRRLRARSAGAGPRLVVCSATLDVEAVRTALGARVVRSEGRTYPVEVRYSGDRGPTDEHLEERVADAVCDALEHGDGDVLVFLPGKRELERCHRELLGRPQVSHAGADVVAVHGGLSPERMRKALAPGQGRRVYLATNVAETSITLPGVRVVVDSGLARMKVHRAGRSVLALSPISQASADQRAGRAGRVAAGRCVRLWSARHQLEDVTPPEIGRVELDDMVLRAAQCGLGAAALGEAPWVDAPPSFALAAARHRLEVSGALDDRGEVTAQGRRRAGAPVSADLSRLLVGVPPALAGTVADLIAVLEGRRGLFSSEPRSEAVEEARAELLSSARDEIDASIAALRAGDPRIHGLHRAGLEEARRLAGSLRTLLGAVERPADGAEAVPDQATRDALVEHLAARWPEAAFARRARGERAARRGGRRGRGEGAEGGASARRGEPWGNGEIELMVRPFEIPGRPASTQPDPPEAGFVLDHVWLGLGGRRARGMGRMVLVVRPARLAEVGIGEVTVGTPRLERRSSGAVAVSGEVVTTLGGTELSRTSAPLAGAALRAAVTELIVDERLMRGVAERLRAQLHWWDLLGQAGLRPGGTDDGEVASLAARLEERLAELGLERGEDFALLEPEDLLLDVEGRLREAGVDPRPAMALRDDFPPTWIHADARYDVEVSLDARRVKLTPANKRARAQKEPSAALVPRFRGFTVFYEQASRRVKLRG